jgi:hypothetical protein
MQEINEKTEQSGKVAVVGTELVVTNLVTLN